MRGIRKQRALTLCILGNYSKFCHLPIFFKISTFKKSFRNIIKVSNGLDSDQDRHSVGPDLRPNCLQRLSADDKSLQLKDELLTCI